MLEILLGVSVVHNEGAGDKKEKKRINIRLHGVTEQKDACT
jgi:hypothetical protein